VLLGLVFLAACASEGGAVGTAEVNLLIIHPNSSVTSEGFPIDRVDYRVTCAGTLPGSMPIPPADTAGTDFQYDDSVDMSGAFQIIDTGTPPVWQATMDLPPGLCTMTLTVWDGDEITCLGSETLTIVEDTATKFDITLVCSLSVDVPDGSLSVDGTIDLIDGNYCPHLVWLGADPTVLGPVVPAVTTIQTTSFDLDNTCGQGCDPQTCVPGTNPLVCTPGPDLGLTSTLYAPSGVGTFADANAPETTYTCDPLFPGPTEICALASDGDIECDHFRCLTIVCP
jgi:hypothetical protein